MNKTSEPTIRSAGEFLKAIGVVLDSDSSFKNTITYCRERGKKRVEANQQIVKQMTDELFFERFGTGIVFDYFFERVINLWISDPHAERWAKLISELLLRLKNNVQWSVLVDNPRYIKLCQTTSSNHVELFRTLIKLGFNLGSPIDLIYQLIIRGELKKLELISMRSDMIEYFDLHCIPGAFAIALYNGMADVLVWLETSAGLSIDDAGNVLCFEHLPKGCDTSVKYVIGRTIDYPKALEYVLAHTKGQVSQHTVKIWNRYVPEHFVKVFPVLKKHLIEPIPLEADFGDNNYVVHGMEWATREQLVHKYQEIRDNYERLQVRFDEVRQQLVELINVGDVDDL